MGVTKELFVKVMCASFAFFGANFFLVPKMCVAHLSRSHISMITTCSTAALPICAHRTFDGVAVGLPR